MAGHLLDGLKLADHSDVKNVATEIDNSAINQQQRLSGFKTAAGAVEVACSSCLGEVNNSGDPDVDTTAIVDSHPPANTDDDFLSVKFNSLSVGTEIDDKKQREVNKRMSINRFSRSQAEVMSIRRKPAKSCCRTPKRRPNKMGGKIFGQNMCNENSLETFAKLSLNAAADNSCCNISGGGKQLGKVMTAAAVASDSSQINGLSGLGLGILPHHKEQENQLFDLVDQDDSIFSNSKCNGKRKRSTSPQHSHQFSSGMVTCGQQVRLINDVNPDDLAGYLEDTTFFPKKMSYMAEMMYT